MSMLPDPVKGLPSKESNRIPTLTELVFDMRAIKEEQDRINEKRIVQGHDIDNVELKLQRYIASVQRKFDYIDDEANRLGTGLQNILNNYLEMARCFIKIEERLEKYEAKQDVILQQVQQLQTGVAQLVAASDIRQMHDASDVQFTQMDDSIPMPP